MNRKRKLTIVAGTAAALVLGAGVAGAVAASGALSPSEESEAIIEDAAEELGVEPSALSNALKAALKSRVDAAVEAGRLTEDQGQELKERIDSGEVPLLFGGLGHHGLGHGVLGGLEAAADFLGLTESELRARLHDGESLADIARDEGKSVDGLVAALVADANERLEQAVAEGKLTQAKADAISEDLEDRIRARVNGEHPSGGPGFGRFGPRGGFFGGPHGLLGPRA
jgi:polyhydroxyalkanoate synthesis regulator phasin